MGILWYFHDVAINNFWRISMGFLKGCYGNSMVFLWDFHWIPMGYLWYFYDVSMIFLWDFFGTSEEIYGILMGFLCSSYAISMLYL